MDPKIITGLLLCLFFMASISVSQSASARLDSRLRYRRQNDETDEGTNDNEATTTQSEVSASDAEAATVQDGATGAANEENAATAAAEVTNAATEAHEEAATEAQAEAATEAHEEAATEAHEEAATEAHGEAATEAHEEAATEAHEEAATEAHEEAATEAHEEAATEAHEEAATEAHEEAATEAHEEGASTEGHDEGHDEATSEKPGNGHETEGDDHSHDATTAATEEGETHDATTEASEDHHDGAGMTTEEHHDVHPDDEVTTIGQGDTDGEDGQDHHDEETTPPPPGPVPPEPSGPVELRVVVSPDVVQGQRGQTIDLVCTAYGGDASTSIYWIQEEPERRYALTDPPTGSEREVTASKVTLNARMTLDDPSKFGKYTCMAQDGSGNVGTAQLTVAESSGGYPAPQPPVYPDEKPTPGGGPVTLRVVAPDMADGDYVEIQCEGVAPHDEGQVQWFLNNRLLSDDNPLYPRGKTLHVRPISRDYLGIYRCSVPGGNYIDGNSIITFKEFDKTPIPIPQPTYPPTQPPSAECGINEARCSNGRCIPRAFLCDGKNDCGDNSDESCGQHETAGSDVCQPNEIQCANPNRGRKCVQKFWMCDGDRDCDDGSDEEHRYCELLPRQPYCKTSEFQCHGGNDTNRNPVCVPRSFQCDGYNDCPDRSDELGCVKPTVTAAPPRNIQVNAGDTLTIQCTARGSPAPYINWRLNWGHICGDGYDNGRCTMAQSIDPNDPTLVTGTLTVLRVTARDGGAYSCEALNNQGFIFALPDAIVNVIIDQVPVPPGPICNCHGHSTTCSRDGQCLNCQHNTAGPYCEHCASGYEGDARRGTPYDCQPKTERPLSHCDQSGTYTERAGRCICKYNVEGERCNQCKRSHFFLNPTTPNGCLPCFCSGVSSDCQSSDWKRQATSLPLNNWNVVPKNFATDQYEARNKIQQRNGGREIAIDQSSLGRPSNEVLYWKAPKEVLGDVVTLYDGTIDVSFTNDGNDNEAPSSDEFIWLRGNNIDLVHKLPSTQRFQANKDSTYSVPVNERTFTRKDGSYIDRENILMALSDLDTLLVKINPIGGQRNAVLRGVTLNAAARDGYGNAAPTVESCHCPANYTGTSCEKCAEGYGRPHPLVGIYLGQCWSCRAICQGRSDQCDRDTGKCLNCQGNTEGDRCERCRAGFVLDSRSHQCLPDGQYQPVPSVPSYESAPRGAFYIDQRPFDSRGGAPLNVVLDGSQSEQRVPMQVLNAQPKSVVWGRTDGSPLPPNVYQEGNDLVFRNPSPDQAGNYICTIMYPDGFVEHVPLYFDFRQGQQPGPSEAPVFSPASPLSLNEGSSQVIYPPREYFQVQWVRGDNQPLPSDIQQSGNALQIHNARPDHSGTYYCQSYGSDGTPIRVPYEIHVQGGDKVPALGGAPPRVTIRPNVIKLKEGQRMIVQYSVASNDPIDVVWSKLTDRGYQPIPSLFTVEPNRLVLNRATPEAAGTYQVVVRNVYGEDRQDLHINVEPRRSRQRGQQAAVPPQIHFPQDQYEIAAGESLEVAPNIHGASGATIKWSKDGSADLPNGVTARGDGALFIQGVSEDVGGSYTLDVTSPGGQASRTIYIGWKVPYNPHDDDDGSDRAGSYASVRLSSRDEQSQHQVGHDIHLQCAVQGTIAQPYEYTFTKDGQPLANNVEVHPSGLIIIRGAQASDSGRYRCEVTFPSAPEFGAQESSFDVYITDALQGGHGQSHSSGEYAQASGNVEVIVEPSEVKVGLGEKSVVKCHVKGANNYKVTWSVHGHNTDLPDYASQDGNDVVLKPHADSPKEQMYLLCQVDVPGHAQQYYAYVRVTVGDTEESSKKKKKRRS